VSGTAQPAKAAAAEIIIILFIIFSYRQNRAVAPDELATNGGIT
jgi:hypothetical protein